MTDWEDQMRHPVCNFEIGHAVKHLNRFRETGDINDLRACTSLLQKHLDSLEKSGKERK